MIPVVKDIGPLRLVWHDGGEGWRYWRTARFAFWIRGNVWEATIGRLEARWRVHNGRPTHRGDLIERWVLADQIRRPIYGKGDLLYGAAVKALREHREGPGLGTGWD